MARQARAASLRTSASGIWLEQPAHAVSLHGPRFGLWLGGLLALAALVLLIFLALAPRQPAAAGRVAIPAVARVTDLTDTLGADEQAALSGKLAEFEQATGAQLAVLVLPGTRPETIEQYGIRLAEAWKLGRKGVDDGVILIVAKDDHKVRIEVGYGLEGNIPDAVASRIIGDTIVPAFKAGNFYQGIDAGVDRIIGAARGTATGAPTAADAPSGQAAASPPADDTADAQAAAAAAAPSEEAIMQQYAEEQRRSDRAQYLLWGLFIFCLVFAAIASRKVGTIVAALAAGVLFAGPCLLLSRWLALEEPSLAVFGGVLVAALSWGGIRGWRSGGSGGFSSSSGSSGGFSGGGGGFGGGGASGSW